jgi:hypothetical protein
MYQALHNFKLATSCNTKGRLSWKYLEYEISTSGKSGPNFPKYQHEFQFFYKIGILRQKKRILYF